MKTKTYPAMYQNTEPGVDEGVFEAIVSVFDNKDFVGDIVRPGAFKDTIAAWANSGNVLPVLWSHRMDDPNYNIGSVVAIEEIGGGDQRIPDHANPWVKEHGGLWVKAVLDDATAAPVAAQVRHLLRNRRVTQFSFAYEVLDSRPGIEEGTTELLKLWLYEVGPTPIGMNPATELLAAKAAESPPPDEPPTSKSEGGRSAAFFRLRAEIAAMAYAHTD